MFDEDVFRSGADSSVTEPLSFDGLREATGNVERYRFEAVMLPQEGLHG